MEKINHPKHYNSHPSGIECITIIRHHTFNVGCIIKYLWRAGLKGGETDLDDLKKARFYLNDEIKRIEDGNSSIKESNETNVEDCKEKNKYADSIMRALRRKK